MASNCPVPSAGPFASDAATQRAGIIFPALERAHDGGVASDGVYASPEYSQGGWTGLRIFIDLTNRHTTGTLVVKVQTKDPASGNWADVPLMTTATLTATATTVMTIYPGISETANVDVSDPLGNQWRVVATVATAHVDFSVGGEYLG